MATIGSLVVAFRSETSALEAGIDSVVNSLSDVQEAVNTLRESLTGLSSLAVSITADTSSVEDAGRAVAELKETVSQSGAEVAVTANTADVEQAGDAVEDLSTAIGGASQQAAAGRDSLASFVVTVAAGVGVVRQAIADYGKFRQRFIDFVSSATGATSAGELLSVVYRGLAGDADSLRVVFGGVKAAIAGVVEGLLSVDNVNALLQGSLGTVLRLFGVTDSVVTAAVQSLAELVTRQIATAASARLVQRSLQVVSEAYDVATNSLARFLTETQIGRDLATVLARGLQAIVPVVLQIDAAFGSAVSAIVSLVTSTRLMGAVMAATGTAFDSVSSAVGGMSGGLSSLSGVVAGTGTRLLSLLRPLEGIRASVPSVVGGFSAMGSAALAASRNISAVTQYFGPLISSMRLYSSIAAEGHISLPQVLLAIARTVALDVAMAAAGGTLMAFAGGASLVGGAMAAASTAFSLTTPLAIAAAVATGKVAHALQHVGDNAEMMGNLSDRFGQPVQEIEKLKIAAEQTGVALNSVVRAQQIFSQNVSKIKVGNMGVAQTREARAAMTQLGISVDDLRSKKPEDLFVDVAREISKVPDATKRTQIAMDLFGRTGPQLLPLLKNLEQVNEDIGRLGGTISDLDFERFQAVDQSFDRLKTASGAMADDLAIPFTRMQEAWNNASAEIIGGLAPLVGATAEVIADMTTPFAVLIEIAGRVVGTLARIAAAAVKLVTAFLSFGPIAILFETLGDAFNAVWKPVEAGVAALEEFASAVEEVMRPTVELFKSLGEAVTGLLETLAELVGMGGLFINTEGDKETLTALGAITTALAALAIAYFGVTSSSAIYSAVMATSAGTAVASAATTAAAWVAAGAAIVLALAVGAVAAIAVYVASVIAATATTVASCVAMHVAWLFGLGPIGLVIGAVELLVVGVAALYALGGSIVDFFSGWGEGKDQIDGATASVEELAAAAAEAPANQGSGLIRDLEAAGRAAGATEEQIAEAKAKLQEFAEGVGIEIDIRTPGERLAEAREAIAGARGEMGELSIRAAKFGQAGADAASKAGEQFNELQRQLASGTITTEEFQNESAEIAGALEKSLDEISKASPEETLKRNLELYKQLDDAIKGAGKSLRDLTADRQVGDDVLPASDEVKRRAAELKNEYTASLEAIKKKQASGGFQAELDQRRSQAQADFDSGRIDSAGFATIMAELDSTNAQEQASIAVEGVQREFDRKQAKIKADLAFADDIRKRLDEAFLSPVQKMEKELRKIADNPDLNPGEKSAATAMVRREARTQIVGKSAQANLTERTRDLNQARESGLIGGGELTAELKAAMDDFASAVGVTKTPFEAFSSSLDNIAKQFGFAGQPIDEVRKKLSGNAEQLALFDRALQDARDSLLQSLGIEKTPQEVFKEQMEKIDEAVNATDPNKRITAEQAEQARDVARRKRDAALGAGEGLGDQFRERERNIEQAFGDGGDPVRREAAMNRLAIDRRQAAGLDPTASQKLKDGVDKINDAFGVTGMSMAEIQKELDPSEFAEYQEAIKENADKAKASLGVEKTGAEKLAESRKKLDKAVADGVITQDEANKAMKEQRDSLLSSLGISKTPAQDFEDAVQKIQENAAELNPDEIARGLKEAKDKLLSSLGIDKSPLDQATDQMDKLTEAFAKGQISAEEFARGMQKTRDTMLQSLGIPLDPVTQLAEKMRNLDEALAAGVITNEEFARGQEEAKKALLPGGEEESPVKKFQRDMDTLSRAQQQGLISGDEFNQRKMNLQADLQESLKPALDRLAPDRRGVEGADVRSKAGVDTFFRILRGNDNPSLKAQLEIARNTRLLAEVAREPDAAPVIAQLGR